MDILQSETTVANQDQTSAPGSGNKTIGDKRKYSYIGDAGEEEILCWSGPPKPTRSPIQCKQRVIKTEPVCHVPRNTMHDVKKSKTSDEKVHGTTRDGNITRGQPMDSGIIKPAENNTVADNKKKLCNQAEEVQTVRKDQCGSSDTGSKDTGVVHPRQTAGDKTKHSYIGDVGEEKILCWSGPPKPPRSPVHCNQRVVVTEPICHVAHHMMRDMKKFRTLEETVHKKTCHAYILSRGATHKSTSSCDNLENNTDHDTSERQSTASDREVDNWNLPKRGRAKILVDETGSTKDHSNDGMQGNSASSRHIPPIDPLCHVPILTPPPIKTMQTNTPP
jgi:hypothetical protein